MFLYIFVSRYEVTSIVGAYIGRGDGTLKTSSLCVIMKILIIIVISRLNELHFRPNSL